MALKKRAVVSPAAFTRYLCKSAISAAASDSRLMHTLYYLIQLSISIIYFIGTKQVNCSAPVIICYQFPTGILIC